jgi:hypothetical protein
MGMISDARGKPGDIVLVRGGQPITIWRSLFAETNENRANTAGRVSVRSLGIIISVGTAGFTYVLWSNPCIAGWTNDGHLRPVKVK